MPNDLSPFFQDRENRTKTFPQESRAKFETLEQQARDAGDTEFGDRQFVSLWLSNRTGIPRDEVMANFGDISGRYFGKGTTAAQSWDKISSLYQPPADGEEKTPVKASDLLPPDYFETKGYPRAGPEAAFYNVSQSVRSIGSGFSDIPVTTMGGFYSQLSTLIGEPTLRDPMTDPKYAELASKIYELENPYSTAAIYPEAGSYYGPSKEDFAQIDRFRAEQKAIRDRMAAENRDDIRKWQENGMATMSEEYRKKSEFWYELSDELDAQYGVDPRFAETTIGQFMKGAGSMPATMAMAGLGVIGGVTLESMFFGQVEKERMSVEGASYNSDTAVWENMASAVPKMVIERAFGVERILTAALKTTARTGGKIQFGEFARNVTKKGLMSGAEEGLTEPTQGFWNDYMASITYDEKRELYTEDAIKVRFLESLFGFTMGAIMGGGISALNTLDMNKSIGRASTYLTSKQGDPLNEFDFKMMRSVKTDDEIREMAPDPKTGDLMVSAANGDEAALKAYNKQVYDNLFVKTDGVQMDGDETSTTTGGSLGTVLGQPVFKDMNGNYFELDLSDPEHATFVEHFKRIISDQIRISAREDTIRMFEKRLGEGSTIEVNDEVEKTVGDFIKDGQLDMAGALERIAVAKDVNKEALDEADALSVKVLGNNVVEYRDNMLRDVSKLWKGSSALTVVEEVAEGYIKKRIKLGDLDEAELIDWRAKYEADTGETTTTEGRISNIEWFSKRVVDYAVSNRKATGMPKSWGAVLRTLGDHLKTVLKMAAKMSKLQRDGALDAGFEAALKGALGITTVEQAQTEVNDARAQRQAELDALFGEGAARKIDEAERESPEGAQRLNYDLRRQEAEAKAVYGITAKLSAQAQRLMEDMGYGDISFSLQAMESAIAIPDFEVVEDFPEPKKTVKAYKLFRTKKSQPGKLFPLFIGKTKDVPVGKWMVAENIPTKGFAKRPGWHAGARPEAPHLLKKDGTLSEDRVWAEVEMPAETDYTPEALQQPTRDFKDRIPDRGFYRFSTQKKQGEHGWIIGGALKVNRTLSATEVDAILASNSSLTFSMAQTDTPAFKKWFGDSKVVDKDGNPLVVYHGTDADFESFDRKYLGQNTEEESKQVAKLGFWFNTTSPNDRQGNFPSVGSNVEAYLALSNPIELSFTGLFDISNADAFVEDLKAEGYDGIITEDTEFGGTSYIAFEPTQIKSAIGNRGTFDPGNPDITFSLAEIDGQWAEDGTLVTSNESDRRAASPTVSDETAKKDTPASNGRGSFRVNPVARGRDFRKALERTRDEHPQGAAVAVYDLDTYLDPATLLFQSEDRLGGVMVTPTGDLQSVHKVPGSTARMKEILAEASEYASTLDAFDIGGFLPKLYGQFGFVQVARVKFSKDYAPDKWNYDTMGEPDVVLMVRDTEGTLKGFEPMTFEASDYDTAADIQKAAKEQVGRAKALKARGPLITFSMEAIAKPSAEYDGSRVGTAMQTLAGQTTTQDTNVAIENVTPENLEKQMDMMTHFTKALPKRDPKTGEKKIKGVDVPFPEYLTKHTDPEKRKNALIKFMVDNLLALHDAFPEKFRARATHWYDGARLIADHIASRNGITPEQSAGIMAAFSPMKDWFQNVQMALNFADVFANDLDVKVDRKQYGETIDGIVATADGKKAQLKRKALLKDIDGRSIRELWDAGEQDLAGWAARIVSTQKHGLDHDVLAPEGFRLGVRRNKGTKKKQGEKKTMVWQSTPMIVKALSIEFDGSLENISLQMGEEHKIRNFYNNIIAPNSPYGDATIDTHAVNAALLYPMGGSAYQTELNFGKAGVAGGGNSGTYWLHLEALRIAAKKRGLQPRQMQSITWEAVRMLFPDASKRNAAWVDKYAQIWDKAPNANRARAEILRDTIGDPEWARSSDPEGDQGGEATSGEEVQGEDVRQRDLRPTLRHGSAAGDDGSGVTFSLEENKAAAYELSGVPVSEKQALDAQFERIRAKSLAASADLIKRMQDNVPLPERVQRVVRSHEASLLARAAVPISGRLQRLAVQLAQRLRRFEFDSVQAIKRDMDRIRPFMDAFSNMKPNDARLLDLALKNGDVLTFTPILKAYGMEDAYSAVVDVLTSARARGIAAGYEVGYIENYFPRKVLDLSGLQAHYYGDPLEGVIDAALKEAQLKAQAEGRALTRDEQLIVVNRALQGNVRRAAGPGNFKGRKTDVVSVDADQFYADSIQALIGYVESTNHAIEKRRFFGKFAVDMKDVTGVPGVSNTLALDASIGGLVSGMIDQGILSRENQDEVISILEARFNQGIANEFINNFKSLAYLTSMGQVTSALTQFADLAFSMHENGVFNTLVAAGDAFTRNSKITRASLGIDNVAEEFKDVTKMAKLVNGVFKATGLHYIDMVGKETLVNAKFAKMQQEAQNNKLSRKTQQLLETSFTPEQAAQVVADLSAGNKTPDTLFCVYSVLADYQPINLSEYPEAYLRNPNGRIFYMLKTFTLKQIESFRREGLDLIVKGSPAQKVEGMGRLMKLAGLFYLINIPVDWIKDFIMGRDPQMDDLMVDNIFKLMGFSRWHVWNFRYRSNPLETASLLVLPAAPFIQYPFMDMQDSIRQISKGEDIEPGQFNTWRILPIVGSPLYWHFGGGATKIEERREEREGPPTRIQ